MARRRFAALAWMLAGLACAPAALAGGLALSSPDIGPGGMIPKAQELNIHGCTGANLSPALRWSDPPSGTRSFALTLFDRDARGGLGWWHWVVLDIPAGMRALARGAGAPGDAGLPAGARQGRTSFGFAAYGGPCPPRGEPPHHYILTLYALRVARVAGPRGGDPASLAARLRQDALATAELRGTYGRPAAR
ncbi:MAG: YbhB/YbcL family Raf kinase inhibitor-like protein [Rhodospirillales bacterium]|jgi:Raf kinase inhibitor-like YbhB/YbcL family protein|nr:YbhB/YbcL family Raf kinase inhibitor-like protein [Rhodospirillales bacterium]